MYSVYRVEVVCFMTNTQLFASCKFYSVKWTKPVTMCAKIIFIQLTMCDA